MPTLSTQATFSGTEIMAFVAALGLSSTAGLRACLTLFAVGLASDVSLTSAGLSFVPGGTGPHPLILLNGNFHVLGSIPVLIVLAILALAEFVVDKIPGLDHVNDLIHTVVRPLVGAVILAGTTNTLSDINVWVAAITGFLLAFSVHGAKSGARVAVTTTTAGVGNPFVSLGEDLLAVGSIGLLIFFPIVGLIVALIVVLLAWRLFAWMFGSRRPQPASSTQPVSTANAITATAPQRFSFGGIPFRPLPFMNPKPTSATATPDAPAETAATATTVILRSSRPIPAPNMAITDPLNAPTLPNTRQY